MRVKPTSLSRRQKNLVPHPLYSEGSEYRSAAPSRSIHSPAVPTGTPGELSSQPGTADQHSSGRKNRGGGGLAVISLILGLLLGIYLYGSLVVSNYIIGDKKQQTDPLLIPLSPEDQAAKQILPSPERITFTNDGLSFVGDYYDNPNTKKCAVVMLHGIEGNRLEMLEFMPTLWERGCGLLSFDARGHGSSSPAYRTYGAKERNDTKAAFEWLQNRTGLPPEDIGLYGISYGAATAIQALDVIPTLGFVIADSPFDTMRSVVTIETSKQYKGIGLLFTPLAFPLSGLRADFDVGSASPKNIIKDKATPLLLTVSKDDVVTPAGHAQAIFDNANNDLVKLVVTDFGAEHTKANVVNPEGYKKIINEFLDQL